jgi:hypothetical protein
MLKKLRKKHIKLRKKPTNPKKKYPIIKKEQKM